MKPTETVPTDITLVRNRSIGKLRMRRLNARKSCEGIRSALARIESGDE